MEKREFGQIYMVMGLRVKKETSLQNNIIKIIPIIYIYIYFLLLLLILSVFFF